jgi:hypothetical protein
MYDLVHSTSVFLVTRATKVGKIVNPAVCAFFFLRMAPSGCNFFRKNYTQIRRYALEPAGTLIFGCWSFCSDGV